MKKQFSNEKALYDNIVQQARKDGEVQAQQFVSNAEHRLYQINSQIKESNAYLYNLNTNIAQAQADLAKYQEDTNKLINKINRLSTAYKSASYSIENFFNKDFDAFDYTSPEKYADIDILQPTVKLKLHSEDLKDLRKLMRENNQAINKLLKKYEVRYTTKTNKALYQLMVLALRAELQNILSSLKYEKLDKAINKIK